MVRRGESDNPISHEHLCFKLLLKVYHREKNNRSRAETLLDITWASTRTRRLHERRHVSFRPSSFLLLVPLLWPWTWKVLLRGVTGPALSAIAGCRVPAIPDRHLYLKVSALTVALRSFQRKGAGS